MSMISFSMFGIIFLSIILSVLFGVILLAVFIISYTSKSKFCTTKACKPYTARSARARKEQNFGRNLEDVQGNK